MPSPCLFRYRVKHSMKRLTFGYRGREPGDDQTTGVVLYWSAVYVVVFWVVCALLVGCLLLLTECALSEVC